MRVGFELRLLAARAALALGGRGAAIERLFVRTAAAFDRPLPPRRRRSAGGRLREYALFTRSCAEEALRGTEGLPEGGRRLEASGEASSLDGRLFNATLTLGSELRRLLGVRTLQDAMAAARLVYRAIGIDFAGQPAGAIVIRRCSFAAFYSCRVCALVSALDRGLLAGLSKGRKLSFTRRLTEGADSCRAFLGEVGP